MRRKLPFDEAVGGPEVEVVIAGDWHSNSLWIQKIVPRIRDSAPQARTLLHVGDFNIGQGDLSRSRMLYTDAMFQATDIRRGLIALGNHDDHARFRRSSAWAQGVPHQLNNTRFYAAPRPFVLTIGGRRILLFGGAASLQADRREGYNYWSEEVATDAEYDAAGQIPGIDVLITHEGPNGATSATAGAERGQNPLRFSQDRLAESARSRQLTTTLNDRLQPALHFHGHLHAAAEGDLPGGRRVIALAKDEDPHNLVVLNLASLTWRYI